MLKLAEFWHIIRIFLVLTTTSLVFGACTEMRDNNPAAYANNIPDPQSNIDLKQCAGASLLDGWAYFASAGPDFPIPLHDDRRQISHLYFNGKLNAGKVSQETHSFDPTLELNWKVSKEFNELYLKYVPTAYLSMCFENLADLKKTLSLVASISQGLDGNIHDKYDNKINFLAKLLTWELKLYLANHSKDIFKFEQLRKEIDGYTLFPSINISNPKEPRLGTDHLRLLSLKARIYSEYAIIADDPILYNYALNIFELVENSFAKRDNRRQAYMANSEGSPFKVYRFTRSMNLLNWMNSIQRQIEIRPDWLQDISEQLSAYEERIISSYKSSRAQTCRTPSEGEFQAIISRKKQQLLCRPIAHNSYTSLGLKVRKYEDISSQFSQILFFEDSPMLWAQHQYSRYYFYRVYVNKNRDKFHPKRTEEFCLARRALENTLRVIPHLSYDRIVLNWC